MTSKDPVQQYRDSYFDWSHADLGKLLARDVVSRDYSSEFIAEFFQETKASSPVDKALQVDSEIMLVDDPVKRVDNMTMAFGLEARVPFLDHEVVELAARIPAKLKVGGGGKYILKQAARKMLPAKVIDRPKGYFPVPSLRYLEGPFLTYVNDILTSEQARSRGLYRPEFVDHMLRCPEAEMSPKGHSRLWQATVLEAWMQAHGL